VLPPTIITAGSLIEDWTVRCVLARVLSTHISTPARITYRELDMLLTSHRAECRAWQGSLFFDTASTPSDPVPTKLFGRKLQLVHSL